MCHGQSPSEVSGACADAIGDLVVTLALNSNMDPRRAMEAALPGGNLFFAFWEGYVLHRVEGDRGSECAQGDDIPLPPSFKSSSHALATLLDQKLRERDLA